MKEAATSRFIILSLGRTVWQYGAQRWVKQQMKKDVISALSLGAPCKMRIEDDIILTPRYFSQVSMMKLSDLLLW